jgi:hypothetical protein
MFTITSDQRRQIKEIGDMIERLHPAIKRKLCLKLIDVFERSLSNEQRKERGEIPVFTRAGQIISWIIYEHGRIGYLALKYFIKYYQETLDFEDGT